MISTASGKRLIGLNESKRALQKGEVKALFIAKDAKKELVEPIVSLAEQQKVKITYIDSMKLLGKEVGIGLKASVVAVLKHGEEMNSQ